MAQRILKLGTRGSFLARTQTGHVRDWMGEAGFSAELEIVTTAGDVNMAPVERIGVGVFTQALREALEAGQCDIAVHSFKDLPTAADNRFELVVPRRQDPREALIARDGLTLEQLPEGARVGTSAPRRISQLKALRPDLDIQPLRGNIDTRMGKVTSGELDAVMLAYAGLVRAGEDYAARATEVFDTDVIMPAPAQGALAIEARVDDDYALEAIRSVADSTTIAASFAERRVLSRLEAGCTAPVAATSQVREGTDGLEITVRGGVYALDGSRSLVREATGSLNDSLALGDKVAEELFAAGAAELLN